MRIFLITLVLLLCSLPVTAETAAVDAPAFSGFRFGEAPSDNMLCTAGPCTTGLIAEGHHNPGQRVAVYKLPIDATHVEGVEISAPEYSFHQNQLFRVGFNILCAPDRAEHCMASLADSFEKRYGMVQIGQNFVSWGAEQASLQMSYRTATGARVEICRSQEKGLWQQPFVSIYLPTLMDAVRLAANPDYQSDAD